MKGRADGAGGGLCGAGGLLWVPCEETSPRRQHQVRLEREQAGGLGCLGPGAHRAAGSPPQEMFAAGSQQLNDTTRYTKRGACFPLSYPLCYKQCVVPASVGGQPGGRVPVWSRLRPWRPECCQGLSVGSAWSPENMAGAQSFTKSGVGALEYVASGHCGDLWLPVRQTAVEITAVRWEGFHVEKSLTLLLLVPT